MRRVALVAGVLLLLAAMSVPALAQPMEVQRPLAQPMVARQAVAGQPSPSVRQRPGQQPPSPPGGNAYDTVASCLRERGHLLLVALIDESGSLQTSDPDGRRVVAIKAAVRSFAQFGRGPDSSDAPRIELLLAAFATRFTEVGPWAQLNEKTLGGLEDNAEEFARRNTGQDTDLAVALDGARNALANKESEIVQAGGVPPCRLLLVFTDGQYDIDSTAGERKYYAPDVPLEQDRMIEQLGREYLCTAGGVADQLRGTGTVVVAIALRPDAPGAAGPPDQSFLRGLAEAQNSAVTGCGQRVAPPGVLVEAQGLGLLLEAFDGAVVQALGGTSLPGQPETAVCAPADPNPACVRSFELDTSLSEFHILVDLFRPGISVELTPPSGGPRRLVASSDQRFTLGGAELDTVGISPLALVVDGKLPPDNRGWMGTWTVRFVDETGTNRDAVTRSQITVFGGLTAVADPQPAFRAGERTQITINVIDTAGSPRTPAEFVRSSAVRAHVSTPAGERHELDLSGPRADGSYLTSHAVPSESSDPYHTLVLTLDVTTRGGLQLRSRVQTYQIAVQPPAGFPLVAPVPLRLTRILDEGDAFGMLTVTGTPGGTGCAWFEGITLGAGPPGVSAAVPHFEPQATSKDSCVRVEPGQQTNVSVRVSPDKVRSGLVEATLRVRSTGADPDSRATLIPVSFEMQREPGGDRPVYAAVLMAVGVLLPLGLLWVLNWLTARFAGPGVLRRAIKDVQVTADDVEASWVSPLARNFTAMPAGTPTEPCRSFEDNELEFSVKVPVLPLRLPYGRVRADDRDVFASGGSARGGKAQLRGRLPLHIHAGWVFVVDRVKTAANEPDAGPITVSGRLFLYINEGGNEVKANELIGKVRRDLPALIAAAADRLHAAGTPADGGSGGSGRPGGSGGDPTSPPVFVPPIRR